MFKQLSALRNRWQHPVPGTRIRVHSNRDGWPVPSRQSPDSIYIQDCLNGKHSRRHQAAANMVLDRAINYRYVCDGARIATEIRAFVNMASGW